ncbi:secretin receptor-like [Ruditapes philippinarum]|uniref:secretin receptor-like n=1 Tax=Ruditapes philippinarum TaxID=129788 RepID=UPI00295AFDA4|nr:secretin receptor-like [Ruditapes philippinarum]
MTVIIQKMKRLCEERIRQEPPMSGLYCKATWDGAMCWDFTSAGSTAIQLCAKYIRSFNPTEYATRECLPDGTWKPNFVETNNTIGWTNYTNCLSNNPKPQLPIDKNNHIPRIQLMSEIGYGISLASLIVAVTIMIASRRLHCKSNVLHINLFCAFILRASVSFLKSLIFVDDIGLEKDIIRNPGGTIEFKQDGLHWECKLIVSIFMYSVATSMMWILMEGLYLHMLVYKTLFTERHGTRLYVLFGWLSSFTYIIPWIVVRIFKDNELCWNRQNTGGYFWIIKAPMHISILINFLFFINIVRVLCVKSKLSRHVKSDAKYWRKTAKFVLVLLPLFGVVYIAFNAYPVGVFSMEADFMYLYCEMFYNSFQGFVLALLFCFLNEEVQNEIRRWCFKRRLNSYNTRSILLSSWRKSSRRMSRDTTRDTRISSDCTIHPNGTCTDTANLKCVQEHVMATEKSLQQQKRSSILIMAK